MKTFCFSLCALLLLAAFTRAGMKSSDDNKSTSAQVKKSQHVNSLKSGTPLYAVLTGAAEAPGPGDPDGSGWVELTLNQGLGIISFELSVEGIAPATAAHIHIAPVGSPGPVVVPLTPPTDGFSSGDVSVDPALIKAIRQNPGAYYVNVHNAEYPAGAVRGQLTK